MRVEDLPQMIKRIVERIRPDLSAYMRFPVQGRVTAVNVEAYTCDVQPSNENMALLPDCGILSPWATETTRLVILPAVNDLVMVGFENGDHDKPYIQGFFPDQGPEGFLLLESEKARIKIAGDGKVEVESDVKVHVNAPAVELGANATEALVMGDTFQPLFNNHQHIGNNGAPTSTVVSPLNGQELSQVSKTE